MKPAHVIGRDSLGCENCNQAILILPSNFTCATLGFTANNVNVPLDVNCFLWAAAKHIHFSSSCVLFCFPPVCLHHNKCSNYCGNSCNAFPFSFWSCDAVCCRWPGSLSHALKSPFRSNHSRLMLLMTWRGKEITLPFHPAALTASRPQCSPRLDMEDAPQRLKLTRLPVFWLDPIFLFLFFFIPSSDHLALHCSPLYTFTRSRCTVSQLYSCSCWMMSELNKPDVQFKQRVISQYSQLPNIFQWFLLLV